ncbi:TolB family protein [Streptomyces nigra]|uniref:TolB family protein n=1 Tax=Streptomyces nigra TaxID=1827580 RepID=UPI0038236E67
MSSSDAVTGTDAPEEHRKGRRWFVSRTGGYVLSIGPTGTAAVALAGGAPVLLTLPRPGFVWPATLVIDPTRGSVTASDTTRKEGEPRAWAWSVPRRLLPSIARPEPLGSLPNTANGWSATVVPDEETPWNTPTVRASPDGRFVAESDGFIDIGIHDRTTGAEVRVPAGWYSRRWLVGGPWWTPDGRWLVCSWYTTKHVDHGWISALSREDIERHFASPGDRPPEWSVTQHPNGKPYPETEDEEGSYDLVHSAGLSDDSTLAYFVDSRDVAGFSFPHGVPLFRVPRPELANVRRNVTVPTSHPPLIAWAGEGHLAVATEEGRLGGVWTELGLMWSQEADLGRPIIAFDARETERVALTDDGRLWWWTPGTEPRVVLGSVKLSARRRRPMRLVAPGTLVAAGTGGDLLVYLEQGAKVSTLATGLPDVRTLEVSPDGSTLAAIASSGDCVLVRPFGAGRGQVLPVRRAAHLAFRDERSVVLVDDEDFLYLDSETKRHVNHDGSFGAETSPTMVVVFMDALGSDEPPQVLGVAFHESKGIAVALRSGLVSMLHTDPEATTTTSLDGRVPHALAFNRTGTTLAVTTDSRIHLLTPLL